MALARTLARWTTFTVALTSFITASSAAEKKEPSYYGPQPPVETIDLNMYARIRDEGVLVGLSAHNPALIELAEVKGWDVDYYMCCLYYLTRPREEYQKLLGDDLPLGEIYLPSDPPRMFKVIWSVRKPCLAYKVLAAGRRVGSPAEVRRCFETALTNIKPTDALIVGMYQQFGDQVGENAALVRELCGKSR